MNNGFRNLTNSIDIDADIITTNELTVNNTLITNGDLKVNGELKVDNIDKLNNPLGINIKTNLGINAIPNTFGINLGGNINVTGNYFINGVPIVSGSSNWTNKEADIFRNSKVGIGNFSALNSTMVYDLQLGPINTTQAGNKFISLPILNDSNAGIIFSECSAPGAFNQFGFQIQLNGSQNRLEILSGTNVAPLGAFNTRAMTIARDTGYMSIGGLVDTARPLTVNSVGTALSEQFRVNSAGNTSQRIVNNNGALDLCVAGAASAFSSDAAQGDSVIKGTRKMILQNGSTGSAMIIDAVNNIGINTANTVLGTYKLQCNGTLGVLNNSVTVDRLTTTNDNGFRIKNSSQTTQRTGLFSRSSDSGFAMYANENLAIQSDSIANISIGGTNPVVGQRLRVDGNINTQGGNYLVNGSQISTSDVLEGSNLYYTDTRARQAISVSSSSTISLTYNNLSGVISAEISGTAGGSNWTLFGATGIVRNSRVGINTTFLANNASALYIRTSFAGGIQNGIQIDSETTSSLSIRQSTINNHLSIRAFSESFGLETYRFDNLGNYQLYGIDGSGNFFYNNSINANGCNLRLTTDINTGIGRGYQINFGSPNVFHVNQEIGGFISFFTNGTNSLGGINERWRISASGSFNNVGLEDSINALRVTGNVLLNNIALTANSILNIGNSLRLGVSGSTGITIDSQNNINCSTLNLATFKPQQIFSLSQLNGSLSYLSVPFHKLNTTSNMLVWFDSNYYNLVGAQQWNAQVFLHNASGVFINRNLCEPYRSAVNTNSQHQQFAFSRICTPGMTGGQTYTARFLFSAGLGNATSNSLFGFIQEVPI